ncbi:hypothetical protein DEAC_c07870 [Desulfosporosinus acididurans]|uniref:DUF6385 domain-containing protein n=1 Tax=Desulfosporosinus acididurans TaxID=476652 RepID=A0A0J1FWB0_9FIRM|nr:DUF6385 domain-containing protein [Desulfosporosinus acididurans]KLU67572.1 hypothetical protein DEAC_c07870 [Desulfosporosinus acididurans]
MKKTVTNQICNGDFKKACEHGDFPQDWLPIGGNYASKWNFMQESQGRVGVEIINSASVKAGIIQTNDSTIEVSGKKHWLVKVVFQCREPALQVFLYLYPILANGDVLLPRMFCFNSGSSTREIVQFRKLIIIEPEIKDLRLETGIMGPGQLALYKLVAHPLTPKRFRRMINKPISPPIEHIQSIGEILKPIQLATPIPLNIPVNIQAKVHGDIRNLTSQRDKVQIYGSMQVPLATTSIGRAQVEISGHGFQESIEEVSAGQVICYSTIRDVSALSRYSFAIYNMGPELVYVQAQLSPDGFHWLNIGKRKNVEPETIIMVAPEGFLRYARLSFEALGLTSLRVWVQAQN